jgi:hypothetical protein
LKNDPYEKNIFRAFDFIAWIDGKIENQSFAEVAREKVVKTVL